MACVWLYFMKIFPNMHQVANEMAEPRLFFMMETLPRKESTEVIVRLWVIVQLAGKLLWHFRWRAVLWHVWLIDPLENTEHPSLNFETM
jgi:hypothetical protein